MAALLRALAQPAPAQTRFVERRDSALLSEPLWLVGELSQPDADTLVREVRSPYLERATIRDGRVTVERADGRSRRFALRRAPELAALLASFRALLAGDATQLAAHFDSALTRGDDGRWTLLLSPREPKLRERIAALVLHGRGDTLACLALQPVGGDRSLMLLGPAAEAVSPPADAALREHCGSSATP